MSTQKNPSSKPRNETPVEFIERMLRDYGSAKSTSDQREVNVMVTLAHRAKIISGEDVKKFNELKR